MALFLRRQVIRTNAERSLVQLRTNWHQSIPDRTVTVRSSKVSIENFICPVLRCPSEKVVIRKIPELVRGAQALRGARPNAGTPCPQRPQDLACAAPPKFSTNDSSQNIRCAGLHFSECIADALLSLQLVTSEVASASPVALSMPPWICRYVAPGEWGEEP